MTLLVRMKNATDTLGNTAVFSQRKYSPTLWPGSPAPRHLPKRSQSICSHKDFAGKHLEQLICTSLKLETVQVSMKTRTNKQVVVHADNKILLNKRNECIVPWLVWLSWLEGCPLYPKVVGSIPIRGEYERQPIEVSLSHLCFCLCYSLCLPLFLSSSLSLNTMEKCLWVREKNECIQ